jgi:hypothetical protein
LNALSNGFALGGSAEVRLNLAEALKGERCPGEECVVAVSRVCGSVTELDGALVGESGLAVLGESGLGFAEVLLRDEFGWAGGGSSLKVRQCLLGTPDAEQVNAEDEVCEVVRRLQAECALKQRDGLGVLGLLVKGEALMEELVEGRVLARDGWRLGDGRGEAADGEGQE